jgi:hypothetical protein
MAGELGPGQLAERHRVEDGRLDVVAPVTIAGNLLGETVRQPAGARRPA